MSQIPWSELVGEQTETLLAVLLYNEYPEATRVRPSRGDWGIDVLVPTSQAGQAAFDVYQIKKFATSLTVSQKGQIEESFRRLLLGLIRRDVPIANWYLVMPLDPTIDNFLDWFTDMPDRVIADMFIDPKLQLTEAEKVEITAWRNKPDRIIKWEGRPLCESLAGKYPFVVDYYLYGGRDRLMKAFADLSSIYLTDASLPTPSTAGPAAALLTPGELQEHLFKLLAVIDTDPHFRYGISLDVEAPEIVAEPGLVAATQASLSDGRTITVRIKQRFAEALSERPIPMNVKFLAGDATFDQHAFEMWRKYGKPLVGAPAEVDIDLPGGLGSPLSGGVVEVSAMGAPGEQYEVRFRIRRPDMTAGPELFFSLTASTGPDGTGVWERGSDASGLLHFESLSDLETRLGTWTFSRGSTVGKEVSSVLPITEFLQELGTPNVLQVGRRVGRFVDHLSIPEPSTHEFPESVMQFLRALAVLQEHTSTPILMPDLTTVTVEQVRAVAEAAALASGQVVIDEWQRMRLVQDGTIDAIAGPQQEVDLSSEYQLLTVGELVVDVGDQRLVLGSVSSLLLSARYVREEDGLVALPYRNKTMQKNFSPLLPDAAGAPRSILGRVVGSVEEGA